MSRNLQPHGNKLFAMPDGGNCSAVYELRNENEWVKLGSKRDLETTVVVPFGQQAPELPRITRGVGGHSARLFAAHCPKV